MSSVLRTYLMTALMMSPALGADYLRDIKPILEHKCYACHGALKQQGGLRVDTAASLFLGGDSGTLIEPNKPSESYLIEVLSGEAGFQMPPKNEGTPLSNEELELIRDWISEGAPKPEQEEPQVDPHDWWSYRPIRRPPVPSVQQDAWCRNDIDRFVASAREQRGLPATIPAAKAIWLRRVYLDLIGLPPTREELHKFLADNSADAEERVVDDLLARPQYGERWGRHWMDIWRYSDWYGSRGINEIRYSQRHIWRWRDWIIDSLNADIGYDQMIREMLAADELSDADPKRLPATGYLGRNWYRFDRNVWMFETVERTAEAFLGMTLRCCRCHDHKFDPVSQEEYYRFRAFFEPHDVRTDPVSALTETVKDAKSGQVLEDGIPLVYDKNPDAPTYLFQRGDSRYPDESNPLTPGVPAALGGNLQIAAVSLPATTWYPMLRPSVRETLDEKMDRNVSQAQDKLTASQLKLNQAESALANAKQANPNTESSDSKILLDDTFQDRNGDWKVVSGQWEWKDGKLIQSQVGSFATMVFQKTLPLDFDVHLKYRTREPGTYRSVGFSFDYQDQGNSQDIYTSTGDARQSVQAFHRAGGRQFYPSEGIVMTPLTVGDDVVLDVSITGSKLTIILNGEQKLEYTMPVSRKPGKFALWVHEGAAEFLELQIREKATSIETLTQLTQQAAHELEVARKELEVAKAEAKSLRLRLSAEVTRFVERNERKHEELAKDALAAERAAQVAKAELELIQASDSEEKTEKARQSLEQAKQNAVSPEGNYSPVGEKYATTSSGRRTALARWMTDSRNPRTARVAVNHIWGRHIGRPLVETTENFGLNGKQPSHPKLLDWLAVELIENDWSMKHLHRQIVLSSTYRLSSQAEFSSEADETAIASDPENRFLWRMNSRRMEAEVVRDSILSLSQRLDLTRGGPEIPESQGETNLRRSLYFRNTPNEKMMMLEVFDVADPNACYRRKESVVPQQSLAIMNSGLAMDSARILAQKLEQADDFVVAAYETILGRLPIPEEEARCDKFLSEHTALLNSTQSEGFAAGGSSQRSPAADSATRARENLVHVLLMHNDFVTIR